MPPNSRMSVTHAVRHLNDDERPLTGLDRAPLDRSLSSGIVGETVTNVSQPLLAHHGGLRGLVRLEVTVAVIHMSAGAGAWSVDSPDRHLP